MTMYLYECPRCGAQYEMDYKIGTAPSGVDCDDEDCGGMARLVIGTPTFSLKGSCWARDGYGTTDRSRKRK